MSKTKIIFKHAMLITLLIGGFFFLSKLIGQENNPYLRFLNIVFVIVGIRQAIKTSIEKNNETNYATNYGIAIGTSALGVIFSTIGVLIYVSLINPNFLNKLNNSFLIGGNLSVYELVFTLIIEGLASSIVGSLIIMQYFKNHETKLEIAAKKSSL